VCDSEDYLLIPLMLALIQDSVRSRKQSDIESDIPRLRSHSVFR
jgi:hypothetical protein